MDSTLLFAIFSLATWRLTSLLVNEDGPWDMFQKLRYFSGVRYDDYSKRYGTTLPSRVLNCVWCASVWIACPLAIPFCLLIPDGWRFFPFVWLALSAVTIMIDNVMSKEAKK